MVVDTSAVIAIVANEDRRPELIDALSEADRRLMSAVNYHEANVVLLLRFGAEAHADFDLWLDEAQIEIVPFTRKHAKLARQAYRRYGKGIGAANLNLADCAAYALAVDEDDALLFVGNDFARTDVRPALERF